MVDSLKSQAPFRHHELKTWPEFFDAVQAGHKTFEVRLNDREYAVGDLLLLQRWNPVTKDYTYDGRQRRTLTCRVSYVLQGGQFGIEPGFVVMSFERL